MMSHPTTTYADGFGVWHCQIVLGVGNDELATQLAEAAITREIKARSQGDVLTGVALVERTLSRGLSGASGSIYYHFKEL